MQTKIKFCGIRRREDIEMVNALQPDYVGFVFWPGSSRAVDEKTASALRKLLDSNIRTVGVFVDELPERAAGLVHRGVISVVQLHGHEDRAYIRQLRGLLGGSGEIWQACIVKSREELRTAAQSPADRLLFDAGRGAGEAFDWNLLRDFPLPYFLAGGLSADNVGEAIQRLHPYGVDVSSAIETDKVKDPEKMEAFYRAVREAERIV